MGLMNLLTACGGVEIPDGIIKILHLVVVLIQVAVPIMLIIWGMIDFAKATIGGDEDKIKAGQKTFIKRLIAAVLVFLVVTITQLVLNAVTSIGGTEGSTAKSATECVNSIMNGIK